MLDLKNKNNDISYIIEVSNTNMNNILENYDVIDNNHIRVISNDNKIGNIIKAIILNDINIYEIKKDLKTLEDIFLDYTGGNIID